MFLTSLDAQKLLPLCSLLAESVNTLKQKIL